MEPGAHTHMRNPVPHRPRTQNPDHLRVHDILR
jgi:hypothetical protein